MLKAVFWVVGQLPLLISLVTVAVSVVEAISGYLKEGGREKKSRAIALIRENLDRFVTLPDWLAPHLEALLGILIDAVVLMLNLTRGKDWGNKVEERVAEAIAVGSPVANNASAPLQNAIDQRLDELQARLERER